MRAWACHSAVRPCLLVRYQLRSHRWRPLVLYPRCLQFWQRFRPDDNEIQACKHMRNETLAAATNMRTVLYDGIQKLQNNIHSEAWQ